MATEIELKYLVISDDVIATITSTLINHQLPFEPLTKELTNCYFETNDHSFRQHDMGLRVRSCNGRFEQTIKTAGIVIGGLHQRPEYNIELNDSSPNLSLFPQEIWQRSQNVKVLQNELIPLFSTNFTRNIWTIKTSTNTVVELAFDEGKITANGKEDTICEIELELVKGERDELFKLAQLLFDVLALRPGIHSKAARGYALCEERDNENAEVELSSTSEFLTGVPLTGCESVLDVFIAGLDFTMHKLQTAVDDYILLPGLIHLSHLSELLTMLHYGIILFNEELNTEARFKDSIDELQYFIQQLSWVENAIYLQELVNKTGNFRKKLEYSKQLISQLKLEKRRVSDVSLVIALLHSARFNQLQMSLLQNRLSLKVEEAKIPLSNEVSEKLQRFAIKKLKHSLQLLTNALPQNESLTTKQYLAQQKVLNNSLLTGVWLGGLFDPKERVKFKKPWLDIKQGLNELQALWILQLQLQLLDEEPVKLMNWQKSKVDNLVSALDQSRAIATSNQPYWYKN